MERYLKRKNSQNESTSNKKEKNEPCPHAEKCFRRNPHHFREFSHPHLIQLLEMDKVVIPDSFPQDKSVYLEQLEVLKPLLNVVNKPSTSHVSTTPASSSSTAIPALPRTMLEKWQKTEPYNIFFTTIPVEPNTYKQTNSISFTDLLCPSLGILKCSLQINFMIDIMWLMEEYKVRNLSKKPLTILYGDKFPDMKEFIEKFLPNVTHHYVKMKDPFGCHHSKIGIYVYEDESLRVVISTANLYHEDWNIYNQSLWMSPRCPKLPKSCSETDGESPTGFKISLINYLKTYDLPILNSWINYVENCDFSAIKVFLVTSVPGKHYPKSGNGCHLHRVADLLLRHCQLPVKSTGDSEGPSDWGVLAQASSIGSLGKSPGEWLRSTFLRSLAAHNQQKQLLSNNSNTQLSLVYPSEENVLNGEFGSYSGGCLLYSKQTNAKQLWLKDYLHVWKADLFYRSHIMPHIKTYCRVSPCLQKLAWFLLTSSNISKAAWGGNLQKNDGIYVRSYECGVLFLPKFFNEEYFEMGQTLNSKNKTFFPFMYDLPLISYKSKDSPWCN